MEQRDKAEWIIQRLKGVSGNEFEPWPGYCEALLTRSEMIQKLDECVRRWPEYVFRGFNTLDAASPAVRLQIVR